MHREHRALLRQAVTVEPFEEEDGFGAASYDEPLEYPARVRPEHRMVPNREGEEKLSSTMITLPGPPEGPDAVDPRSRVTLPDGSQPPILAVQATPDELGEIDHFTIRVA